MISLRMNCSFSSSFNKQNKHLIMDDDNHDECVNDDYDEDGVSMSSSSCDVSSVVSSEEESSPASSGSTETNGALQDMSSLLQQLPFKKGLSKHYNGKSQSFTSLANVNCLEDLAKPENPYNKRLKSCKSYGLLDSYRSSQPHRSASSSRLISKKTSSSSSSSSRGSTCSSLRRNGSFLGNRPPVPHPHGSTTTTTFTNQTPLFA